MGTLTLVSLLNKNQECWRLEMALVRCWNLCMHTTLDHSVCVCMHVRLTALRVAHISAAVVGNAPGGMRKGHTRTSRVAMLPKRCDRAGLG
jgi:hypothetical protein